MIAPLLSDIKKSRAYQEIAQEGKLQGMLEGKLEGKLETAKALLQKKMSVEFIVEVTGLSRKQVLAISKAKRGRKVAVHKTPGYNLLQSFRKKFITHV